jgi:hypothetical protein
MLFQPLLCSLVLATGQGEHVQAPPAQAPPVQGAPANGDAPANGGVPGAGDTPDSTPPAESRVVDEVVQIVNEDMLTSGTFLRAMRIENQGKPIPRDQAGRIEQKVHENSVKYALRIQAGQDMGLDPAQVDREARAHIEDMRDKMGPTEFAETLRRSSMTLYEYQEWIRDRLYSSFWENYITGSGSVGQGARPSRDRFVRPGFVRFRYQQCLEHPQLLPEIGGRDQSVILQQLILDPKEVGGVDAAKTLAGDLRRRILGGEDMSELVERYGALKANHGMNEPHPEALIAKADPALGIFIAEAKPGELSEVQEFTARGRTGVRIARLIERLPAVVPELSSIEVQKKLAQGARKDLSDWRLDQAFKVLFRASYVWSPSEEPR